MLDDVEIVVLLSDSGQKLDQINANVPGIYYISLDATEISPTLVWNQNTAARKRGSWIPFKI